MNFELNEEQRMVQNAVREFAEKEIRPVAREYDEKGEYPFEVFKKAAKLGFIGIDMPEEYGGGGGDFLSSILVSIEFTRADSNVGSAVLTSTLGCPMLKYFGSEEQKERYLRAVLEGKTTSGIAITEPDAGSDVAGMRTVAKRVEGGWSVNGSKTFITNGSISDWIVLLAKTNHEAGHRGISAFVVETHWAGYEARRIKKMGLSCHDTCELFLKDVFVPEKSLVGEENRGFYQLMRFFNESRVGVAATQLGIAIGAYEMALEYAKQRKAFGKPLVELQAIQFKLADMWKEIEAARLLVYEAAWLVDRGKPNPALSSAAKLFASETAIKATYEALQIFGSYGFSKEYDIERFYRDARAGTIYEGTSEIQRLIIARAITGEIG